MPKQRAKQLTVTESRSDSPSPTTHADRCGFARGDTPLMGLAFAPDDRISELPPRQIGSALFDVVCKECWALLSVHGRFPTAIAKRHRSILTFATLDDDGEAYERTLLARDVTVTPDHSVDRVRGTATACAKCGAAEPRRAVGTMSRDATLERVDTWSRNLQRLGLAHDVDELYATLEEAKRDEVEDVDPGDDRACLSIATQRAIEAAGEHR